MEDLELELIDYGVEEIDTDENGNLIICGEFQNNSEIQKYLEDNGFEINSAEFERVPNDYKTLTADERASVQKLIDKIEEDEDVQNVYTNMAPEE